MKIRVLLVSFTLAGAMFAGTALAQVPNTRAETQWQQFLTKHPNAQAGLVNDPGYLAKHQGMAKWLQQHPAVSAYARQQGQIGGWDQKNQWHDRGWWTQNNPAWVHEHHPEWAEEEPQERHGDEGEWDEHHHWHDRHSWEEHHAEWEHHQHPSWHESEEQHGHHGHGEGHHDKD
jgi:hypothetical protein